MSLTRVMHFEQSKVGVSPFFLLICDFFFCSLFLLVFSEIALCLSFHMRHALEAE